MAGRAFEQMPGPFFVSSLAPAPQSASFLDMHQKKTLMKVFLSR
jgi:hypothetical protein